MPTFDALQDLKPWLLALALPPVPPLLLAALGGWYTWRQRRAGAVMLAVGLALAWLSCTERAAEFVLAQLVNPPAPLPLSRVGALASEHAAGRTTAVLVLTGGVTERAPEYDTADLNDLSVQRLRYGVWLARRMRVPLAITGGIAGRGDPNGVPEAEVARRIATEELGLAPRWIEVLSRDTRENASRSVALLHPEGVQRIVVVSHQMHLSRAMRAFRAAAGSSQIEFIAAGVGYRDPTAAFDWLDWTPSWGGYRKLRYAVTEWLGWLAGH